MKVMRDTPDMREALQIHFSALPHPNIMGLEEVFCNDLAPGSPFLRRNPKLYPGQHLLVVMPRSREGDLLAHIMYRLRRVLDEDEGRVVLYQCAQALAFLHERGLVHGDVKLENFVVDDMSAKRSACGGMGGALLPLPFGLHVRLIDFDAKFSRKAAAMPATSFTKVYVAPEIVMNKDRAEAGEHPMWFGTTADVWALGCAAYMMLIGQVPFNSSKDEVGCDDPRNLTPHLRACVRIGAYAAIPAHLSADTRDLIHRMLDPNPATRITAAQMLEHPFFNSLGFGGGGAAAMDDDLESLLDMVLGEQGDVALVIGGSPDTAGDEAEAEDEDEEMAEAAAVVPM